MKILFLFLTTIMLLSSAGAQVPLYRYAPAEGCIFGPMPEAPYDVAAFMAKHMVYPADAKEKGIEGKVLVKFVVLENGEIDSAIIKKSVFPSLDREALRIVCAMPPWKPGKQDGKPVKVSYTLPIIFRLD